MSIMDDYKQLRMIENIKNLKEMEIAYKANLKLCKCQEQQINKLATCIEKIKPILELYANSKIGEEQLDGTYKIMLGDSYIMFYDPRPAREALRKISEVKNVSSNS